jgi:hypothetical protein
LLERLRSFGVGVVIASQSVEGLHDDPGERARLLGSASTVIAHRLADPEAVAGRAGTVQRAERSHQLDQLGATGMGSLRIQETYRIDPNDLRNLPPGVAWITTAGRALKVAVARTRSTPLATETRPAGNDEGRPAQGHVCVATTWASADGPEEVGFVEVRLAQERRSAEAEPGEECEPVSAFEQQALPMNEPTEHEEAQTAEHSVEKFEGPPDPPARRVSPYAQEL